MFSRFYFLGLAYDSMACKKKLEISGLCFWVYEKKQQDIENGYGYGEMLGQPVCT